MQPGSMARVMAGAGLAAVILPGWANPPTGPTLPIPEDTSVYRDAALSGGPGKDGIPSIDEPRFENADQVGDRLAPGDRIVGIHINGEARAYPQSILVWHEIVNDTVGGEAVAVTFCPLTGTALGFQRGDTELGVSGRLVNSNLIMYDRATDSEWPQILGSAISGPLEGQSLAPERVVWTTWERWLERHPDTEVLTTDTGFFRNYQRDPYGAYNPRRGYYEDDSATIFPVRHESDRYPPKAEVFGFRHDETAVAVDREALAAAGMMLHPTDSHDYLVIHDAGLNTAWVFRGNSVETPDPEDIRFGPDGPSHEALEGLEPVHGFEAMWFAWFAVYPDTVVLDGNAD